MTPLPYFGNCIRTDMTDLFDFKPKPTAFAVVGTPVAHSKSPQIHQMFGEQCGVALEYDRIQVDIGGFEQAVSHFRANGGAGLNVTVPFKGDAWRLCRQGANRLSAAADQAQAVNTLKFDVDGTVFGDNTDGAGLVADLEHNLGFTIQGASVLLVGAGGAVRGVVGPVLARHPERLTIANRTRSKAADLAARFDGEAGVMDLDQSPGAAFDLVVNGTAASLEGRLPGIDPACFGEHTLAYDMMYQPEPTVFMKSALAWGAARASDGLGMLVEQAAASFLLWHGRQPDTKPVIEALRRT